MVEHITSRIPKKLKEEAERQAEESEKYSNGSELIRDLIRRGLEDHTDVKQSLLEDEEFIEELKEKIKD